MTQWEVKSAITGRTMTAPTAAMQMSANAAWTAVQSLQTNPVGRCGCYSAPPFKGMSWQWKAKSLVMSFQGLGPAHSGEFSHACGRHHKSPAWWWVTSTRQ